MIMTSEFIDRLKNLSDKCGQQGFDTLWTFDEETIGAAITNDDIGDDTISSMKAHLLKCNNDKIPFEELKIRCPREFEKKSDRYFQAAILYFLGYIENGDYRFFINVKEIAIEYKDVFTSSQEISRTVPKNSSLMFICLECTKWDDCTPVYRDSMNTSLHHRCKECYESIGIAVSDNSEKNNEKYFSPKISYSDYLLSDEWKERAEDMKRKIGKCQIGNASKKYGSPCSGPLQVHHNTYERIGREFDSDLIVVCKHHHEIIHEINDRNTFSDLPKEEGVYILDDNNMKLIKGSAIVITRLGYIEK